MLVGAPVPGSSPAGSCRRSREVMESTASDVLCARGDLSCEIEIYIYIHTPPIHIHAREKLT